MSCWRALAFLAGAAVAGAADDAKAPLAETSHQLDQLQKEPANGTAAGEDNSLRSALPTLGSTLQGREALPATDLATSAKDRKARTSKKDLNRNWLVDGYEKLDPKANHDKDAVLLPSATTASSEDLDGKTEATPATTIDIFALYQAAAKDHAATSQSSDHLRNTVDPLAPYLQVWLAKSPDRELLLADTPKADVILGGSPANAGAQVGMAGDATSLTASDFGGTAGNGSSNPYLATLALPSLDSLVPTAAPVVIPALPDFSAPNSAKNYSTILPDNLVPPVKADGRKPPPSPADEDRKYFPQLNRF